MKFIHSIIALGKYVFFLLLFSQIAFSQSWEESMGSGMGEIESRVRSNRVKKETEDNRSYYNPLPSYDFVPPAGRSIVSRDDNSKTYMLGHTTIPGVTIATANTLTSIQAIVQSMQYGYYDESIQLQAKDQLNYFNENGISGIMTGFSGGQEMKAYWVSITNGYTGGVSILAITYPHLFTQKHIKVVNQIAKGIKFF